MFARGISKADVQYVLETGKTIENQFLRFAQDGCAPQDDPGPRPSTRSALRWNTCSKTSLE
ncbi:MAG: DUF4258 domain-containing protein [Terriglobia bacterium]